MSEHLKTEISRLTTTGFRGFKWSKRRLAVSFDTFHLVPGTEDICKLRVCIDRCWVDFQGRSEFAIRARKEIILWWAPEGRHIQGLRTPLGEGLANWLDENDYFPTYSQAIVRREELKRIKWGISHG